MYQGWSIRLVAALLLSLPFSAKAGEYFPEIPARSQLLKKSAISISYNLDHKQADWVSYPLGPNELHNCFERKNKFRPDPELSPADSAQLSDYDKSGYDRGHLSPAGDNKKTQSAMSESFLLSNISPQPPRFNQGIWARLENLVRAWALNKGGIWLATGPLLHTGMKTVGNSRISVADHYYKVLVTQDGKSGIGILMPTSENSNIAPHITTIREVEQATKLNFFSMMSNQDDFENTVDTKAWDLQAKFKYLPCQKPINPLSLDFFSLPR